MKITFTEHRVTTTNRGKGTIYVDNDIDVSI